MAIHTPRLMLRARSVRPRYPPTADRHNPRPAAEEPVTTGRSNLPICPRCGAGAGPVRGRARRVTGEVGLVKTGQPIRAAMDTMTTSGGRCQAAGVMCTVR